MHRKDEETPVRVLVYERRTVPLHVRGVAVGREDGRELPRRGEEDTEGRAPKAGRLFQEHLASQPFWMLVACSLVNRTTWDKARTVHSRLKLRYKTAKGLAAAAPEDLHGALRPLGLWRQRSRVLVALAQSFYYWRPSTAEEVARLPGCGKYAADSWAIFIEGRTDVRPDDGKLRWYTRRRSCTSTK
jgi:endonuclease III